MKKGFTLAELMVVMLILTIMLAVMAPIMTKRRTTSPEMYCENIRTKLEAQINALAEENMELQERVTDLESRIDNIQDVIELAHGVHSLNQD